MPTSPTRQSLLRCAVGAALVALLAGCTAGASPRTTTPPELPSSAPAPTFTPSPTAAPTLPAPMPSPTPPPEMSRDDEAGAIAAATYFLTELYPYTVSSQDTVAWVAMSHPDCNFCASAENTIAELQSSGERAVIAPIRATLASWEELDPARFGVFLSVETGPDETWTDDDRLVGVGGVVTGEASIAVVRQGDAWIIRGVELKRDAEAAR